jgi:hypothetical protein
MKSHGIEFLHRNPAKSANPEKDIAEFMAFASLCAHLSVNEFVRSVMFDTSDDAFHIEVKDVDLDCTEIGALLEKCVDKTLSQAVMFGRVFVKNS